MNARSGYLAAICLALLGSNGYLLLLNSQLRHQHDADQASQLPTLEKPLTPIEVWGAQGPHRALVFSPAAGQRHLLLALSPDCPFCQKNWPMWDTLLQRLPAGVDVTYFDVTGKFDEQVSRQHKIPADRLITASADASLQARIVGTPTTVLIASDGTVEHVWAGVLDEKQVGDIAAMAAAD